MGKLKSKEVSTHSRLKAAGDLQGNDDPVFGVSTHSRLKAAGNKKNGRFAALSVSTHSRLKAAGSSEPPSFFLFMVSTHSRLKAAGRQADSKTSKDGGFNTQPPEGGWLKKDFLNVSEYWFQHTAA